MKEKDHDFFMAKAIQQALVALRREEVPIGAVIIDESQNIIARSHNKIEQHNCQTAHAELLAIEQASKKRGWRLDGCTLYVTLEPCLMCFGLIHNSRLEAVYFGAPSPFFGYKSYQGDAEIASDKGVAYKKSIKIVGGLKEQESIDILRAFFRQARCKKGSFYEAAPRISQED